MLSYAIASVARLPLATTSSDSRDNIRITHPRGRLRYTGSQMTQPTHLGSTQIGPDPVIEAYRKDIDRTLIRENLRLTVDQRFQQLMALQRFAEELENAGRKARRKE